jgi:hypothetical protein
MQDTSNRDNTFHQMTLKMTEIYDNDNKVQSDRLFS